jgi:hypothetical protein
MSLFDADEYSPEDFNAFQQRIENFVYGLPIGCATSVKQRLLGISYDNWFYSNASSIYVLRLADPHIGIILISTDLHKRHLEPLKW